MRFFYLLLFLFFVSGCLKATDEKKKDKPDNNAAPKILSMTPATGYRKDLSLVVVSFDKVIDSSTIRPSSLVIVNGGTCAALVTAAAAVNKVVTFTIDGVQACTTGNVFTFEIDPTTIKDVDGNAGTGSKVLKSYTFDSTPIAFSSIWPTNNSVFLVGPEDIEITMSEPIGTLQSNAVTFSGACGSRVNTAATKVRAVGSKINVELVMTTPCQDDDNLRIVLNSQKVLDRAGNAGTVGVDDVATYTIDDLHNR